MHHGLDTRWILVENEELSQLTMLNRVVSSQDNARNSQFHGSDCLAKKIQEVRKVGNARNIYGLSIDCDSTGIFLL
jgi:hypothetical protein